MEQKYIDKIEHANSMEELNSIWDEALTKDRSYTYGVMDMMLILKAYIKRGEELKK